MKKSDFKCPKCASEVTYSGIVKCWCDKDFCNGQRCGADELSERYTCNNKDCMHSDKPYETKMYYSIHSPKD
ncbi:hypothetical protein ACOTVT_02830 [Aliarcobacter butzleri]